MDIQFTEKYALEKLELFYQQRITILKEIDLGKLLQRKFDFSFLIWERNVSKIVRELLESYLQSHQDWWRELATSRQFTEYAFVLRDARLTLRTNYEIELAHAENRLVKAFAENFCAADNGIDWQKLLPQFHTI